MSSFVFHMSGKQCQKAFQYRMIMTILIIYAKGHLGKTGYGNVAQTGVSRMGNVRIEGITNLSFYKSKGTFNIFCDEPLFWGKSHKNTVLDSKNVSESWRGEQVIKFPASCSGVRVSYLAKGCFGEQTQAIWAEESSLYHREEAFCSYFMPRAARSWVFSTIPRIEGKGISRMEGRRRGNSLERSLKIGGKRFISV